MIGTFIVNVRSPGRLDLSGISNATRERESAHMKAKNKSKAKHRKILGRDPTSQLYRAIIRYVESKKGSILVIGGVQIEQWPGAGEFKYVVGVRCMGRKPCFPKGKTGEQS